MYSSTLENNTSIGLHDSRDNSHSAMDSALPSPPVSPERQFVKPTLGNSNSKSAPWMTIKAPRKNHTKSDILSMLNRYYARGVGSSHIPKLKTRPMNPKRRATTPAPSASRVQKSSSPRVSTRRAAHYSSEDDLSSSPSAANYVLGRQYSTRSRKQTIDETLEGTPISTRDAVPRTLSNISKKEFLNISTVQVIHDSEMAALPDFQPSMEHITKHRFERLVKNIGLSLVTPLKEKFAADKVGEKELTLVTAFKLTPTQYLDTKKRFFAEKARKTFLGTTFKKTDAQKACKIDVNKASKLYEVFQHCGLLEDSLYKV